jgi:hypothetical protein
MFYAQTMYFRYIRTAKYYGQSPDCPLVILSLTGIAKSPCFALLVTNILLLQEQYDVSGDLEWTWAR